MVILTIFRPFIPENVFNKIFRYFHCPHIAILKSMRFGLVFYKLSKNRPKISFWKHKMAILAILRPFFQKDVLNKIFRYFDCTHIAIFKFMRFCLVFHKLAKNRSKNDQKSVFGHFDHFPAIFSKFHSNNFVALLILYLECINRFSKFLIVFEL